MESWSAIALLMFLGFALILIELFVIPGFGLTGISGATALILACYLAFTRHENPWAGWAALLIILSLLIGFIKFFPRTKAWKRLRLNAREESKQGFSASSSQSEELLGKTGTSLTMLRPAGTATIEGKRVDVITEGIFLPKDTEVKVVKVQGNRIVVRKI